MTRRQLFFRLALAGIAVAFLVYPGWVWGKPIWDKFGNTTVSTPCPAGQVRAVTGCTADGGGLKTVTPRPEATAAPGATPTSGGGSIPATGGTSGGLVTVKPMGLNEWHGTQVALPKAAAAADEMYIAHGDILGTASCNVKVWTSGQTVSGLSSATWVLVLIKGGDGAARQREAASIQDTAARQTGSCPLLAN